MSGPSEDPFKTQNRNDGGWVILFSLFRFVSGPYSRFPWYFVCRSQESTNPKFDSFVYTFFVSTLLFHVEILKPVYVILKILYPGDILTQPLIPKINSAFT